MKVSELIKLLKKTKSVILLNMVKNMIGGTVILLEKISASPDTKLKILSRELLTE